jgi:hypothetical protein
VLCQEGVIGRIAIFHRAEFYMIHYEYIAVLPLALAIMAFAESSRIC